MKRAQNTAVILSCGRRKVTEMEPVAVFIRHLIWGPLVFHVGFGRSP
jgi:hypothetical protein